MSGPAFYFGAVLLGVILSIVGRGLGLGEFDRWALIVCGGLFYYVTCYRAAPPSKRVGS